MNNEPDSAKISFPESAVRPHNGVPTLFINGQPQSGMAFMTYNQKSTRYFGDFGRAGVSLATFGATLGWIGPGQYDYAALDGYLRSLLEDSPDAWIMPRVGIFTPRWWSEAHPEELVRPARHHPAATPAPRRSDTRLEGSRGQREVGVRL